MTSAIEDAIGNAPCEPSVRRVHFSASRRLSSLLAPYTDSRCPRQEADSASGSRSSSPRTSSFA
jgi:hypothetical protein